MLLLSVMLCTYASLHILLGRPWQFDEDSMHHGRLNQYSFLHHDKKIVLHPMSPKAIMHNDVAAARKTKSHDHAEIANHVAAKEVVCLVPNLKLMNC
jgi:hypothetical protein